MNQKKDLSKKDFIEKIIKSFKEGNTINIFNAGSNIKRKIQMRRIRDSIIKSSNLILLEQKKIEKQEWEIIASDVTLIRSSQFNEEEFNNFVNDTKVDIENYKYVGFDIFMDLLEGVIFKRIFIKFSYHSLVRTLERCSEEKISSPEKVKKYLVSMVNSILIRCIDMFEKHFYESIQKKEKPESQDKVYKTKEDYVLFDNLFLPIVMEVGKNRNGQLSLIFTIKTLMPDDYNSAKRTININQARDTKKSIFDYKDMLKYFCEKM